MAQSHETTGEAHGAEALELFVHGVAESIGEPAGPVGHRVTAAERVDPSTSQRLELFPALANLFVLVVEGHCPRAQSRYALMNMSSSPSITASTFPTSSPVRWSLIS